MNSRLLLKATIITLLMPGTGILFIPYFILHQSGVTGWTDISGVTIPATITGITGLAVLLYCIWGFAVHGKGTLAPIDPPKVLVVQGVYRYTRNPMYLAIILVLLSEALFFKSLWLLLYAAVAFLGFHLFVILFEEPRLRSQFGKSYEEYSKTVPRWKITTRGFKSSMPRSGWEAT
jgi:protein-S-isoprenylcysteine O-methyltransferase Ste14